MCSKQRNEIGSIGESNGLFHRPQHGVSPHAPRQRLASPVGRRQATAPRRRARTGRVAGDGQPALLGLRGGGCLSPLRTVKCRLKSSPQLFPAGRPEALAPGEPLSPQPHPS